MDRLTGFGRREGCRDGGLLAVHAVKVTDIMSVDYDAAARCYRGMVLREKAAVAGYRFDEGTAWYRQTAEGVPPLSKVSHEVEFDIAGVDGGSLRAVGELVAASETGIVLLVETAAGERLLVGRSPVFGGERPLRTYRCVADTFPAYDSDPRIGVAFRSEDTEFSYPFAGEFPF